ncbi:MAG: hypothetical protein HYV60_11395 [Planctomycetia bacterium]|nr:hypothetical protein [Planctomycetia bacterium]
MLILLLPISASHASETLQASHNWLRVSTDWEPDAAIASAAAEAKLRVALRQWLTATLPSCARAATAENLTRLLNLPEVQHIETVEQKDRLYGTVVRIHAAVHVPPTALDAWEAALQKESRKRRFDFLMKCVLSGCGLIALSAATRTLDAWTKGYRRGSLGIFLVVLLAALLTVIWGYPTSEGSVPIRKSLELLPGRSVFCGTCHSTSFSARRLCAVVLVLVWNVKGPLKHVKGPISATPARPARHRAVLGAVQASTLGHPRFAGARSLDFRASIGSIHTLRRCFSSDAALIGESP